MSEYVSALSSDVNADALPSKIVSPDAMDWRAASRSRSRVSVMDWRADSRSRSRSAFGRKAYDYASEAQSHALLAQNGSIWPESTEALENGYIQTFPGDAGQWHLSQMLAGMGDAGILSQTGQDHINTSTGDFLAGSSAYPSPFSPMTENGATPGHSNAQLNYEQAVEAASASLAYEQSHGDSHGGRVGVAASGVRRSLYPTLPGISGPGLVDATEENFHPQYGYLPRRVRKTSFDHTVLEPEAGMLPPPMASKVSRNISMRLVRAC